MKTPKIANAVGYIDDDLISAAVKTKRKNNNKSRLKWIPLASCFAVLVIACAALIPFFLKGGELDPIDNARSIISVESCIVWPWEYQTDYERYSVIYLGGRKYNSRARYIDVDLLDVHLGTCKAEGFDLCNDKTYVDTFEVYKIKDAPEDRIIAAAMDGEFYVYLLDDAAKPADLGELIDAYNLEKTLKLDRFLKNEGMDEETYFSLDADEYIRQILSEMRDAKLVDEDSLRRVDTNLKSLNFIVTSEALGVYKKSLSVTEDGYLSTNIFEYGYSYFIGEEAAGKIISYAEQNAREAEYEPYEQMVYGIITEIGNDYVLVDDTVLCDDETDGSVFKVLTRDVRTRRAIEFAHIEVGDAVIVRYEGKISDNNEIDEAYSIDKGILNDGNLYILE